MRAGVMGRELLEGLAPGFGGAVHAQQARQLAAIVRAGMVIETPVQPADDEAGGGPYGAAEVFGLLLFGADRVRAFVELRLLRPAIPAEFGLNPSNLFRIIACGLATLCTTLDVVAQFICGILNAAEKTLAGNETQLFSP